MSRGNQKIKTLLPTIEAMMKEGKSRRAIEKELRLTHHSFRLFKRAMRDFIRLLPRSRLQWQSSK
jgi:hypothetical protein